MILRDVPDGLLVFRQTDHALLSSGFADAWGNEHVPGPPRRPESIAAAARHDDGWAAWELAPRVDGEGRPVDFLRLPVDEHVDLYRHGIGLVEEEDAFAGLVVSLHGERLYTRPFQPGGTPRIARLTDRALDLARDYVDGEEHRQERLIARLARAHACGREDILTDAEHVWRLLQVWDRLSLMVCLRSPDDLDVRLPTVPTRDGDTTLEVRGSGFGDLLLAPYPFRTQPAHFTIEAAEVCGRRWPDDASFRRAYRTAPRRVLHLTARSL